MLLFETLTTLQQTEIVFKIISSILTAIALLVGAVWAYYRFKRQRENYALIDFAVDIVFHKKIGNWWIVELVAFIDNKGKVQHQIKDYNFDLSALTGSDKVTTSEDFGGQVYFPHTVAKGSFLPKRFEYFFMEPGLRNKYSYIARVPVEAEIVILHSWFNYLDGKHSHTAEVTSKVPKDE